MLFEGVKESKPKKPGQGEHARPGRRRAEPRTPELDRTARFYSNVLPEATDQEEHFRHGHWRERRRRIRATLAAAGASQHALNRWDACGSQCHVEWSPSRQKFRLSANYCKSRHCEPCMRAKANLIARNLREKLEEARAAARPRDPIGVRFITLTLRHSSAPLADQLRKLNASFKALRRSPLWKATQTGGAATLEVKWSGTAWHPHLHIVSEGSFLSKADLSRLWHECTGDSFIVDIRSLNHVADACHYLSKYITKGTNPAVWNNEDTAQEWITASRGVRICNTFGSWRGFALTKPTPGVKDWKPMGTLQAIIARAHAGEAAARGILLNLRPPGSTEELPPPSTPPP